MNYNLLQAAKGKFQGQRLYGLPPFQQYLRNNAEVVDLALRNDADPIAIRDFVAPFRLIALAGLIVAAATTAGRSLLSRANCRAAISKAYARNGTTEYPAACDWLDIARQRFRNVY